MKYTIHCLKNYATFRGRASRKEMWCFALFSIIIFDILAFIDTMFLSPIDLGQVGIFIESIISGLSVPYLAHYYELHPEETGLSILPTIWGLAMLIPTIAVEVRRLHDINLGWVHFLPTIVPIIGWIWWIVFGCIRGSEGVNKYGDKPEI
ncbi:MAG: DUF805 domain-containing protein [Paludibacteraceae bacterium]|nr:DUF805 domain-containing protein [Paludibacteraceae bacterium]